MRGRILVIDHAMPTPDRDAGSVNSLAYLRILSCAGYEVTFAPADLARAGHYGIALDKLGIAVAAEPKWASLESIVEAFAPQSDAILLFRAPVAERLLELIRQVAPSAMVVFHPVDLHFLRMEREAALTGAGMEDSAAARVSELNTICNADATVTVSAYEHALLRELAPEAHLHHVPILFGPPSHPADDDMHIEGNAENESTFSTRRDILFVGGFAHRPNVDGVLWFVRDVWPRLLDRGFAGRLIVVGAGAPAEIEALASDRIVIRGHVPDLQTIMRDCRLSVAPLRYGGGIKGKIISSFSYGLPVVATSIAVEGMGLQDAEDVLVADLPGEMADQIVSLYSNEDLWTRLSNNGYRAFEHRFSEASGAENILSIFDNLLSSRTPVQTPPAAQENEPVHMTKFHFVEAYESLVDRLVQAFPKDEAMSLAVGGEYESTGNVEKAILAYVGLRDGQCVFDLGCGSGRLAHALGSEYRIDYFGTDVVQSLLDYAASKSPPNYKFMRHAELNIPLPPQSVDIACAFSVFTHLLQAESYSYLRDMRRVLRPGGHVIFSFLEFADPAHWGTFKHTVANYPKSPGDHLNMFMERSAIDVWSERLGYERLEFIDGKDAPWGGKSLWQSVAILKKPG
jgi:glycosyltransferase involved in cell wall biosynthesis/SAM-dependent methyltransferase